MFIIIIYILDSFILKRALNKCKLTIPVNAPFKVREKFHDLGPAKPILPVINAIPAAPVPPTTVLDITIEIVAPASKVVIVPKEPPLNAKKPVISMSPPMPTS